MRKVGDIEVPTVDLDPTVTTHALNERYTDLATRGLMRALVDDPQAALILLIARLFASVGLQSSGDVNASISTLEAKPYQRSGAPPIDSHATRQPRCCTIDPTRGNATMKPILMTTL